MPSELTVELVAAALCSHAQRYGYDHGANPTIANWNTEYPACPRHLGMAAQLLSPDPRTLLAAALETDEGKAVLAEALEAWWAAPEGSLPGTTVWTDAGGWLGDARVIAAALAKEEA